MDSEEINQRYEETIKTWGEIAELYDAYFSELKIYNHSYDSFLNLLSPSQINILELGAGPGMISFYLSNKKTNLNFTVTDVAPQMVELIKQKHPHFQSYELDIRDLQNITDVFDAIIAGFCIPYISDEDLLQFFKSVKSKLSNQGLFYFSFVPGEYSNSDFQVGSNGKRAYFYFFNESRILSLLKELNFEVLDRESVQFERKNGNKEEHLVLIVKKHD